MKHRLHAVGVGVMILALVSLSTGANAVVSYTVRKGDTLWSIAKRFGAPIDDIKRMSGISANKPLPIGAKLTIPSKEDARDEEMSAAEEETISEGAIARFGPRVARQLEKEARAADVNTKGRHGVIRTALTCRGARYVRGGTSMRGFDCSGLTRYVYSRWGIELPHYSVAQASYGKAVNKRELQPGDLVFFQTRGRRISHVGIYVGEKKFVHASTPRRGVIVSSLDQPYYASRFRTARRLLKQ